MGYYFEGFSIAKQNKIGCFKNESTNTQKENFLPAIFRDKEKALKEMAKHPGTKLVDVEVFEDSSIILTSDNMLLGPRAFNIKKLIKSSDEIEIDANWANLIAGIGNNTIKNSTQVLFS